MCAKLDARVALTLVNSLHWLFWRGGTWSGVPGVGARCGNGLFSTYKSPKFYLSFTILVSFILVRYPDRIGLVNTVLLLDTYRRYLRYGTRGHMMA